MANLDIATFSPMLKELYGPQVIKNLTYKDKPFFALIKKNSNMGGKNMPVPVIFNSGAGAVAGFSDALANQMPADSVSFALTRKSKYRIATVTNETIEASKNDAGAFMEAMKYEVNSSLLDIKNEIAIDLYGDGTGSRGAITGTVADGVVILAEPNDITNFNVGQVIQARDGTNTPRAAVGYVIAVNYNTGRFTVSATAQGGSAATPSGWVSGDLLLQKGNADACLSGLRAWLPSTAPTSSDNFFGVNRSQDTRLSGVYYDGSGQSVTAALIAASIQTNRFGGKPDHCFINYPSYNALVNEMGSRIQYTELKGPANITFEGVKLSTPKGMVKVIPDMDCPAETAFLLQLDTWGLYSAGEAPHVVTAGDGLSWLRTNSADAVEMRLAAYLQVGCNAPGWNSRVALSE